MLADNGTAAGSPNPPASCVGVSPRGNSNSASGLPARLEQRSDPARAHPAEPARPTPTASAHRDAPAGSTRSSGNPASASPSSRAANTSAIFSASRRRATNASARADARSSHCASSTTHSSGRSSAASDSRPRTASPTRNGFGGGPALSPNATRARRAGDRAGARSGRGSASTAVEAPRTGAPSPPRPRPSGRPGTRRPASTAYSSSAVLPTPGSPCTTRTPPCPPRAASSSRSSARARVRDRVALPGDRPVRALRSSRPNHYRGRWGHGLRNSGIRSAGSRATILQWRARQDADEHPRPPSPPRPNAHGRALETGP